MIVTGIQIRVFVLSTLFFTAGNVFAIPVSLELNTDQFGDETGFSITLASDSTNIEFDSWSSNQPVPNPALLNDGVVSIGNLPTNLAAMYLFTWDLAPGDYEFQIFDLFGDGICCAQGNGSYDLTLSTSSLIVGGPIAWGGATGTGVGGDGTNNNAGLVSNLHAFRVSGPANVPLPATAVLFSVGLLGLTWWRRTHVKLGA